MAGTAGWGLLTPTMRRRPQLRDTGHSTEPACPQGPRRPLPLCVALPPPAVAPDSYLCEREAVLGYTSHQRDFARQPKASEKQQGARREGQKEQQRLRRRRRRASWRRRQPSCASSTFHVQAAWGDRPRGCLARSHCMPIGKHKNKALLSFWILSLTPPNQGHQAREALRHDDRPQVRRSTAHVGPDAHALHAVRPLLVPRGVRQAQ